MKRMFASVLLASSVFTLAAQGSLLVNWNVRAGFIVDIDDLDSGILVPSVNPTGQALAQLIFRPQGAPNSPAVASTDGFVSGQDIVVDSLVLEVGSGQLEGSLAGEFGVFSFVRALARSDVDPSVTPGSVFARIFERGPDDIELGTRYYDGELLPVVRLDFVTDPTLLPQDYEANRDELNNLIPGWSGGGDVLNLSVVPEPSTFGLLAIGVLGATLRRRRLVA